MNNKFLKYFLIFLTFIFLFCLFAFKMSNNDIWWHLKTGEYILTQHIFPQYDIFSYTISDHPWILEYWLSQIIFYTIHHLGGVNALIVLRIVLLMVLFISLFRFSLHRTNYFIASLCVVITALTMRERFIIRPELFSFLFTLSYLFILYHYKYYKSRLIYFLPILQLFWVNMHPSFFIGFALTGTFLIGEFLNQRLKIPFCIKDEHPVEGRRYLKLLIVFLGIILVSFLNPNTYKLLILPFTLTKSEVFMRNITEWKSPFSESLPNTLYFKIIITAVVAGFILNYKRFNFTHLLNFIIFLYLGVTARRHTALFALIMAPIIMINLGEAFPEINGFFSRFLPKQYPPLKMILKRLGMGLLAVWLFFSIQGTVSGRLYVATQWTREFGFGVNKLKIPEGGINFIKEHNIKGNIFNDYDFGAYLIWRCYLERKVFIDGRLIIYGEEFCKRYLYITQAKANWEELLNYYRINYCLLGYRRVNLSAALYKDPDWRLVYFDDVCLLFLKNIPANRKIIEYYSIDLAKIPVVPLPEVTREGRLSIFRTFFQKQKNPNPYLNKGILFRTLGLYEKAEEEYKKALKVCPHSVQAYNNLGIVYYKEERYDKALRAYRQAIRLNPRFPQIYNNLGNLYTDLDQYNEAVRNYKKAIRISSRFAPAHYNLGEVYVKKEQYDKAIIEYKKYLRINPDNAQVRYYLGNIYFKQWRYKEAKREWEEVLRIEPDHKKARENLEQLRKMGY